MLLAFAEAARIPWAGCFLVVGIDSQAASSHVLDGLDKVDSGIKGLGSEVLAVGSTAMVVGSYLTSKWTWFIDPTFVILGLVWLLGSWFCLLLCWSGLVGSSW